MDEKEKRKVREQYQDAFKNGRFATVDYMVGHHPWLAAEIAQKIITSDQSPLVSGEIKN